MQHRLDEKAWSDREVLVVLISLIVKFVYDKARSLVQDRLAHQIRVCGVCLRKQFTGGQELTARVSCSSLLPSLAGA